MKIGIDISQTIYGTGVSNYTLNLIENLLKIDKENEYLLFGGSLRRRSSLDRIVSSFEGRVSSKIVTFPPFLADLVWNRLHRWPVEKFIGPVDVFHSSDWTQPPTQAFKVTTVHDLAPLRFPKLTHWQVYSVHKRRLEWVKKEVDRVIVPSEATKAEVIDYGFDEAKIRVIPEAPSKIYKPAKPEQIEALKQKYRIKGKFIASVGVGQRKNTERLIKAYELMRAGADLKLLLIGRAAKEIKHDRGVRYLGYISEDELPALYSGAEALVYPSLYEGFGLPILEAMACGTPVVTSNLSSMPEVAGKAAVLVDPYEVESIKEGIETALRRKTSLSRASLERAGQFSWKSAAEETLEVYKEVLERKQFSKSISSQ